MDGVNLLKAAASSLLADSSNFEAVERAGRMLASIAEIERQEAESKKLSAEEVKIRDELSDSKKRGRSEKRQFYSSLIVPLLSTMVLGGTLLLQTYQTFKAESDKQVEQQAQRQSVEDMRWSEALKSMYESDKDLSVADIYLKQFYNSSRYGNLAKQTAFQILAKTDDPVHFHDLFLSAFEPVSWENLEKVLDLDRSLAGRFNPLDVRYGKLSDSEERQREALYKEISFICGEVATLLKSPRPKGVVLDLRSIEFWDCDLSNADLSEANLDGFTAFRLVLKGADLTGVRNYRNVTLQGSAWWQASRVSKDLLEYLRKNAAFDVHVGYGTAMTSKEDYDAAILRLDQDL